MSLLTKILEAVTSDPGAFDWIQHRVGLKQQSEHLAPHLAQTTGQIVLDVGVGTGNYAPLLPRSATYLGLDIDQRKLEAFRVKWPSGVAIVGDAGKLCLKDKSIDCALCVALSHHLSDVQLPLLFTELARVVRQRLIFLDAVEYGESRLSSLLWRWDQGKHPRSAEVLCEAIERWFDIEQIERFAVYHQYILCVGRARHGA